MIKLKSKKYVNIFETDELKYDQFEDIMINQRFHFKNKYKPSLWSLERMLFIGQTFLNEYIRNDFKNIFLKLESLFDPNVWISEYEEMVFDWLLLSNISYDSWIYYIKLTEDCMYRLFTIDNNYVTQSKIDTAFIFDLSPSSISDVLEYKIEINNPLENYFKNNGLRWYKPNMGFYFKFHYILIDCNTVNKWTINQVDYGDGLPVIDCKRSITNYILRIHNADQITKCFRNIIFDGNNNIALNKSIYSESKFVSKVGTVKYIIVDYEGFNILYLPDYQRSYLLVPDRNIDNSEITYDTEIFLFNI